MEGARTTFGDVTCTVCKVRAKSLGTHSTLRVHSVRGYIGGAQCARFPALRVLKASDQQLLVRFAAGGCT
jgi:hypothetical protein